VKLTSDTILVSLGSSVLIKKKKNKVRSILISSNTKWLQREIMHIHIYIWYRKPFFLSQLIIVGKVNCWSGHKLVDCYHWESKEWAGHRGACLIRRLSDSNGGSRSESSRGREVSGHASRKLASSRQVYFGN
jgi:hypothetical protein